jgi:hypothetical protein
MGRKSRAVIDRDLYAMVLFFAKINVTDTCWLWTGGKCSDGYGSFHVHGDYWGAHRLAYSLFRGEIQDGLELDHLCRDRGCVNPDHLEPVTHKENVLRGEGPTARFAKMEQCPRGHELGQRGKQRHCYVCNSDYRRQYYLERREEKIAYARARRAKFGDQINARRREMNRLKSGAV